MISPTKMNKVVLRKKDSSAKERYNRSNTIKAIVVFKDGSTHRVNHHSKARIKRFIELRCSFGHVIYIDITPPQQHTHSNLKQEAEKGGYNYEKFRKIFPATEATTLGEPSKRS